MACFFACGLKRCDSSRVRLEGQHQQVVHDAQVFLGSGWVCIQFQVFAGYLWLGRILPAFGTLSHLFYFSDRAEVLIHFSSVIGAKSLVQVLGLIEYFVDDAATARKCVLFRWRDLAEHATKNFGWFVLRRDGAAAAIKRKR